MNLRIVLAALIAATLSAGVALVVASRPDGRMHVTVLDTGSATAVLVRTAEGEDVLVDGGTSPSALLQALGRVLPPGSARLDMAVLTGGEQAAVAALGGLPGHYTIGTVVTPDGLTPGANTVVMGLAQSGTQVVDAAGTAWTFGGATWRCLGFVAQATGRSMCALSVSDANGRLLVLGDAGTADQEELCAVYGSAMRADVVVTPPGGAVSPVLLETARPYQLAVPLAKGATAAPAPAGYPIDRTGTSGDISYSGGPHGLVPG